MKQIHSFSGGTYNTYSLPFHYCSLFLFILPVHSFSKGKVKKIAESVALGIGSSFIFFMAIMPTVVYSASDIVGIFDNFYSFHTVVFHSLVLLYFIMFFGMRLAKFNIKHDLPTISIFLAVYVAVATVLANTLKVNFHNLLQCNLPPVENIRVMLVNSLGGFGHMIYTAVLAVLTLAFAAGTYLIVRLCYTKLMLRKKTSV
jgi:hypothetical protein